jgi:nitrogen fixation protein NifU and related proteins
MESSPNSLYHEIVLRHQRNPRNFGSLPDCTHASQGINALCGDRLRVEVDYRDEQIKAVRFTGESCAIAIASASIMSDMVIGRDSRSLDRFTLQFTHFVEGDFSLEKSLGELSAFAELRRHPTRRKCALLPWATLRAALSGAVMASTESAALPR